MTKACLSPATPADIYATVRQAFDPRPGGHARPRRRRDPRRLLPADPRRAGDRATRRRPPEAPSPRRRMSARPLPCWRRDASPHLCRLRRQEAGPLLVELAEKLGAPVATTIQGKGVFPEHHPLWLWNGLGASAPPFAREIGACVRRDARHRVPLRRGRQRAATASRRRPALIHVDINRDVFNRNFPARSPSKPTPRAFVRRCSPTPSRTAANGARRTEHIAVGHRDVRDTGSANAASRASRPPCCSTPAAAGARGDLHDRQRQRHVPRRWSTCASTRRAASSRRWTTPAWATRCRRRSAPSSPTRNATSSPSPATARC